MQKSQSNYERLILGLMAVVAIGVAVWLILKAKDFPSTLTPKPVKTSNEAVVPPLAAVDDAIRRIIEVPKPWVPPVRNNKAVPLNKSVLLALKGEEVIDMFLETPPIRPPMTNEYLRLNNLEWQYSNVGDLDADDDGYSNLEEFEKQTKPKDGRSHPPLTDKLYMTDRLSKDYRLVLRTSSGQVSMLDEPRTKTKFVDLTKVGVPGAEPQYFGGAGDRFKTVSWVVKKLPDPKTNIEKDVSELTLEEIVTKKPVVLVMGVETNLAEYSVVFQFRLKVITTLAPVAKGGIFRIPGHEDTTYRVIDIQEDKAIISALDAAGNPGPEIIIKKG